MKSRAYVLPAAWIGLDDVRFATEVKAIQSANGNLAMLRGTWSAITRGLDGKPVTFKGKNVEVVRRQPDGTRLFVIDNPRGADRLAEPRT